MPLSYKQTKCTPTGYLECVKADRISGWAVSLGNPNAPLPVRATAGGKLIGKSVTQFFRGDVCQALGVPASAKAGFVINASKHCDAVDNMTVEAQAPDGSWHPLKSAHSKTPTFAKAYPPTETLQSAVPVFSALSKQELDTLASHGYKVIGVLKRDRVFLAQDNTSQSKAVIKRSNADAFHQYATLYSSYTRTHCKTLLLAKPILHIQGLSIYEYIHGEQYEWSESRDSPHFGGLSIPACSAKQIVALSLDLDNLGAFSDFYWRNFIFCKDSRIAVIDWERGSFVKSNSAYRLASLFFLMFKNDAWKQQLVHELQERKLCSSQEFHRALIDNAQRFATYWEQHNAENFAKLAREFKGKFSNNTYFGALWRGVPVERYLTHCRYHVYTELGQVHDLPSQIDCTSKLAALKLEQVTFTGMRVLDIGCASGWFMKEFVRHGASHVTGIDIDAGRLESAKGLLQEVYGYKNTTFINGSFETSNLGSYNIITCISMLHYIVNRRDFLARCASVLLPGGFFILELPVHQEHSGDKVLDLDPKRYIANHSELMNLAKELGFSLLRYHQSNLHDRMVYHFHKSI